MEYQWRKHQIHTLLAAWLFIAVISLFLPFALVPNKNDWELLGLGFFIWFIAMCLYGLLFLGFILFHLFKNKYFIKNYKNFQCFEVTLDSVSTSYAYRRSIYYTVQITDGEHVKQVDTNPYFSSSIFAKFSPADFNNKRVVGLYDSSMEKFYIITIID
ncbi:MAG: hypothetical protein J6A63_06465 [Clostridia bacterium]|nr:hypothetical protein [Clostridia bacterium]